MAEYIIRVVDNGGYLLKTYDEDSITEFYKTLSKVLARIEELVERRSAELED